MLGKRDAVLVLMEEVTQLKGQESAKHYIAKEKGERMEKSKLVEKEGMCFGVTLNSRGWLGCKLFLIRPWVHFFQAPCSVFMPFCLVKTVRFCLLVLFIPPSNSEKTLQLLSLDLAKVSQYKRFVGAWTLSFS